MDNNQVTLSGKIASQFNFSHEAFGEKFYQTIILLKRSSGAIDSIPIIVSEKIVDVNHDYTEEDVLLYGQFRTYNRYEEEKCHLVINVFVSDFLLDQEHDQQNVNEIFLDGYICKSPTYRITPLGRQISDFILAVNRKYEKSDYIPCICWGRNAQFVSKMIVGTPVKIQGRIQSREYLKDSTPKTTYEVSVIDIDAF